MSTYRDVRSESSSSTRKDFASTRPLLSPDDIQEGVIISKYEDVGMECALLSDGVNLDAKADRALLRKADLFICSIMCVIYAVQFMDKQTNSYASIMGLREDLDMHGSQYSWVGTSFYLGYMICELPASLALQKFPVAKTSGIFIICWGIVLCLTSLPETYMGFITTRTLLGVLESAVTPAFILLTAQWYKREEQLLRTGIWSASCGVGAIFGACVAYGLLVQDPESLPMVAWRLLYIILGIVTLVVGMIFLVLVPDTPMSAWFLTHEEKLLQVERIRSNKQGFGNTHFKWHQLKEVFQDVRTYLYFTVMVLTEIPNGGITTFSSIIVKNMGFTAQESLLMVIPYGVFEVFGIVSMCYVAQKTQQRMICAMISYCLNIISACFLAFATSVKLQLLGYYLQGISAVAFICFLSCISSNSAGHTKKIVTSAICMIGYCIGNLIGPLTFVESEAPHYSSAKLTIVVCFGISLLLACAVYFVNLEENKRRDLANETLGEDLINSEFSDLTDFENPEFRYAM